MIRLGCLMMIVLCFGVAACGKRGDLSLPPGVETLPDDPSKREDPPA